MGTRGDALLDRGWLLNFGVEAGDPHQWHAAAAMPTWNSI